MSRSDLALLYRRGGFGLGGDELDRLAGTSYGQAVDELLAGLTAPDTRADAVGAPTFTPYARVAADEQARKAQAKQLLAEVAALQKWWMGRMLVSSTPLREKLTLFWHGHFATAVSKVRDPKLMYLQNQLFRTVGAGSFETLTQAVAKDGAMMVWLDTVTDKRQHPNENFAREMMELFTLGIGNYSQGDVTAAARAFTGWTYDRFEYRYTFRPGQHDFGSKTYLGQVGDWNGEDVIHIAVHQGPSARFVLAKLWSHFAYPISPNDPLVSDLLDAYGPALDLTAALRAVFLHPAFRSLTTRTGLVKQPIEYLVGAARILGLDADVARPAMATALGQALFDPPNVGGWGQNAYWLDTATAEIRLKVARYLAGKADLSMVESTPVGARVDLAAWLLGLDGWGATTARALDQVADTPVDLVGLALCSPEYVAA